MEHTGIISAIHIPFFILPALETGQCCGRKYPSSVK